jgi:hypothetical protein
MIQAVATIIGVIVTVIVAIWQNRRKAKELEDDAREDVRQTQVAATAGDEATVQQSFAAWDLTGRMRRTGNGWLRLFKP